MTKKMWLVIALLVTITVLAVSYFAFGIVVFDVEVIALALAVALKTVLSGGKVLLVFFKQTFLKTIAALFSKRVFRPLYRLLGITYVGKVVSRHTKKRIGPKITRVKEAMKTRWAALPRLARAGIIGIIAAVICVMGYGLWLIPIGISMSIISRIQTVWLDALINKKTKRIRCEARIRVRRRKHRRMVVWYRKARLKFLRNERRVVAWIRSRISV